MRLAISGVLFLNLNYRILVLFAGVLFFQNNRGISQDARIQYPPILANSYFGVNIGYIGYSFSGKQLEPGFNVKSVKVPHTAVRIILFGHEFNKYLSAQISYMRPVNWVEYTNINRDQSNHSVWMNIAGLTAKSQIPFGNKLSLSAEAGFGLITRKGFSINDIQVIKNANYGTLLSGASLQYHLNKKWDLLVSGAWSPENKRVKQPATVFLAGGFNYYMRPLPEDKIREKTNSGYIFPKQFILIGYTPNGLGYGVNNFASQGSIPFFWGGDAHISKGFTLSYQRNLFHSKKVFSLDWGAGISYWQSRDNKDKFLTVSLFPVCRFTFLRTKPIDIFFEYSVAGPSFISKTRIDNKKTGKKFTFQDFMGAGTFVGKKRNWNFGIRISHYSNGNLFPYNDGLKIPLTFNAGHMIR